MSRFFRHKHLYFVDIALCKLLLRPNELNNKELTLTMSNIIFMKIINFQLADLIGWYEMFDHTTNPIFILLCQIRPVCNIFFYSIGASWEQMPDQVNIYNCLQNII